MKTIFGFLLLTMFSFNVMAQNIKWAVAGDPQKLVSIQDKHLTRPLWSPDGTMIAFSADNYRGIYLYDLEKKNWRQLTDDEASGFGYSWAADSRSVFTVSAQYQNLKRQNAVKSFRVDSDEETVLSDYMTDMPSDIQWTDNRSTLCFLRSGEFRSFRQSTPAQPRQIARLYFLDKGQIYSLDTELNKKQNLQLIKGQEYLNLSVNQTYSHLAFEVLGGNLYTYNLKTQQLFDLGIGNRPAWSPDGEWLCYMRAEDDGHTFTKSDIIICDAEGKNRQQLTESEAVLEMSPAWSPDRMNIVFSNYSDGAIYILPLRKVIVAE